MKKTYALALAAALCLSLPPALTQAAPFAAAQEQNDLSSIQTGVFFLHQTSTNVNLTEQIARAKEQIYQQRDYKMALATLNQVISLDPSITEAYYLRSVALTSLGEYFKADKDLEEALLLEPENPCLYCARGDNKYHEAEYEKNRGNSGVYAIRGAWNFYKKALAFAPNYLDAKIGLAETDYLDGFYDSALQKFNEMLVLFPNNDYLKTRKEDCTAKLAAKEEAYRKAKLRQQINS